MSVIYVPVVCLLFTTTSCHSLDHPPHLLLSNINCKQTICDKQHPDLFLSSLSVTIFYYKLCLFTDIRLVVRGKAFVHWTEQLMRGPGESRFREIRHHSAREDYVDWSQSLLGRGE